MTIIKFLLLQNYWLDLYHQGFNWQLSTYRRGFKLKLLHFCTSNRIFMIGRKCQKAHLLLLFCRYSNSLFSRTLDLISYNNISIYNFSFSQKTMKSLLACSIDRFYTRLTENFASCVICVLKRTNMTFTCFRKIKNFSFNFVEKWNCFIKEKSP